MSALPCTSCRQVGEPCCYAAFGGGWQTLLAHWQEWEQPAVPCWGLGLCADAVSLDLPAGSYRLLPSIIEEELQQPGQRLERPGEQDAAQQGERRAAALRRIDFLLRSKLLAVSLGAGCVVLGSEASSKQERRLICTLPSEEASLSLCLTPT